MPKKKAPPRTRAEQERIFKEAAKTSGADVSGRAFEAALTKIVKARVGETQGRRKPRQRSSR